jgi:serine protease Do
MELNRFCGVQIEKSLSWRIFVMSLKRTCLVSFTYLLISCGAAMAQDAPAPPAMPDTPEATKEFTFYLGGGSFLGIHPEEVTRENMGRFNLRDAKGVAVSKVIEGSPAEKAGIRKDDVVLRVNGEEVTSIRKLSRLIDEVAPDHVARLTISRNGAEQELSITVGKREDFNALMGPGAYPGKLLEEFSRAPGAYAFPLGSSRRIGVSTNVLTKQLADYFGVAGDKGVLITSVRENSPAAKAGLKAGDVITDIDGEKIDGVGDLSRAINRQSEGEVTLTIVRDKSQRTIRVTPEKGEASPLVTPYFNTEVAPPVGVITIPDVRVTPRIKTIVLPRVEVLPQIKALIGTRPL